MKGFLNSRISLLISGVAAFGISAFIVSCGSGSATEAPFDDQQETALLDGLKDPTDSLTKWQTETGISNGPVLSSVVVLSSSIDLFSSSSTVLPPLSSSNVVSSTGGLSSSTGPLLSSSTTVPSSSSTAVPSSSGTAPSSSSKITPSSSSTTVPSSSGTTVPSSSSTTTPSSSGSTTGTPLTFSYGGAAQAVTAGTTYSLTFTDVRGQLTCQGSGTISATVGAKSVTSVAINSWQTAVIEVTAGTGTATVGAGSSMTCKQDW